MMKSKMMAVRIIYQYNLSLKHTLPTIYSPLPATATRTCSLLHLRDGPPDTRHMQKEVWKCTYLS